ncbi:MAG: glycosyltransferase [Terriglobia bacterium]
MREGAPAAGVVDFLRGTSVCAVIVTYNIGEPIHRCFNSIYHQVGHVILVDNGSDERTRRELDKLASQDSVTLILNERNEGIARAMNQGVELARSLRFRWVLTLDHDSKATPDMVDKLLHAYETLSKQGHPAVGIIAANPFDENAQVFLLGHRPGDSGDQPVEVAFLPSSGNMISCAVFEDVGMFDEAFFMYLVDSDFCLRVRRAGFRLFLCPGAVLMHQEGEKQKRRFLGRDVFYERTRKPARYYFTRNRIYFLRKHRLSFHFPCRGTKEFISGFIKAYGKVLLYDEEPFTEIALALRGLFDALRGRYGPLGANDAKRADLS